MDQHNVSEIILELQKYCKLRDLDERRDNYYFGIFNALYVNKEKLSFDEIAAEFFIDVKTLYKYRIKFNLLAEVLFKQFQSGNSCPIGIEKDNLQLTQTQETEAVLE